MRLEASVTYKTAFAGPCALPLTMSLGAEMHIAIPSVLVFSHWIMPYKHLGLGKPNQLLCHYVMSIHKQCLKLWLMNHGKFYTLLLKSSENVFCCIFNLSTGFWNFSHNDFSAVSKFFYIIVEHICMDHNGTQFMQVQPFSHVFSLFLTSTFSYSRINIEQYISIKVI